MKLGEEFSEGERHPDYESPRALPAELAHGLSPTARHALSHPIRRGILRELNRDGATPRTPDELCPLFPGASRATIAYHANVLSDCGSVTVTLASASRGALTRSFISEVAADPEYQRALAATEQLDVPA